MKHWLNIESKLVRLVGMNFQGLQETIPIHSETHENKSIKSFVSKTFKEIVLFWIATRGGFHALMFQKSINFHSVQGCSAVSILCLKRPCLPPVSLSPRLPNTQSPLIGQPTHARPSIVKNTSCA